jgi:aminoglycoside phosphotransferase (APT) family kinase protein
MTNSGVNGRQDKLPKDVNEKDFRSILDVAGIAGFTGKYISLGGGEVNDTFVLDCGMTRLVLRVTKYDDVDNLGNEARALRLIRSEQAPKLIYFDASRKVKDRSWILESEIHGRHTRSLSIGRLKSLGGLLAHVHGLRPEKSTGLEVEFDIWKDFVDTNKYFGSEQELLNHPDKEVKKLAQKVYDNLKMQKFGPISPVLIHGDVTLSNMLVDGDVVSLIDWEFSRFTDPMADFSTMFYEDMELNKGRWRIHISEREKAALFESYVTAGGNLSENRLKVWHNLDKLGVAIYLYWKLNQSDHVITQEQSDQFDMDLRNTKLSLERGL